MQVPKVVHVLLIYIATDAFRGHGFSLLITSFFRGLHLMLFPLESPPSFQSKEIGEYIDIIMCVFTHIRINTIDFITANYKFNSATCLLKNYLNLHASTYYLGGKWLTISEDSCGKTKHARPNRQRIVHNSFATSNRRSIGF